MLLCDWPFTLLNKNYTDGLFYGCTNLESVDLGDWDLSKLMIKSDDAFFKCPIKHKLVASMVIDKITRCV